MWYQVSEEQAGIICGCLSQKRYALERDLREGVEYPFFSQRDMLRELSLVMELQQKFYDDGSLRIPFGSGDKHFKW